LRISKGINWIFEWLITAPAFARICFEAVVYNFMDEVLLIGNSLGFSAKAFFQDVFLRNVQRLELVRTLNVLGAIFQKLLTRPRLQWNPVLLCDLLFLALRSVEPKKLLFKLSQCQFMIMTTIANKTFLKRVIVLL